MKKIRKIGQFDGSGGNKTIFEFTDPGYIVSSHSCLLPKFTITLEVRGLRGLIKQLRDDDSVSITVSENEITKFNYIR